MSNSYIDSLLEGDALGGALQDVAQDAARAIPGVDSAGVVLHRGSDHVRAASGPLAAAIDRVQYRIGQGPCLHAFHTGRTVLLDLDTRDHRWPPFQAAALGAGAHTVLSLPLSLDECPIGSMNLYSRSREAFSTKLVRDAQLFTRPSALRLSRVGVAVHALEAAEVVALELQDRATIDRALGILMELHQDASVDAARRRLEQTAIDLGVSVPLAAARMVASPPTRGA